MTSEKIFSCLPYIILYRICDLGAGPFLTPVALLNKLDRGPLGDAKNQKWPQVYNLNLLGRGLLGDAKARIFFIKVLPH